MNTISRTRIERLCQIIDKKDLSDAATLLFSSIEMGNGFVKEIALHVLCQRLRQQSLILDTLLNEPELLDELRDLAAFTINDNDSVMQEIKRISHVAHQEFNFLPALTSDQTITALYRTFDEFNKMTFHSFCHSIQSSDIFTVLHHQQCEFENVTQAIIGMENKPYGFHLCILKNNDRSIFNDTRFKLTRILISNQVSGVYIANFSIIEEELASLHRKYRFTNPFFSVKDNEPRSNIPVTQDGQSTLSALYSMSVLHRLSFICYLIANQHKDIFQGNIAQKMARIGYQEAPPGSLMIRPELIIEIPAITPEDLAFSGDYQVLSFLDEIYQDELNHDLNIVLYQESLPDNVISYLSTPFNPTSMHDFSIKKNDDYHSGYELRFSSSLIRSIPDVLFDNQNPVEKIRSYVMFNKMALYAIYLAYDYKEKWSGVVVELQRMILESLDSAFHIAIQREYLKSYGLSAKNHALFASDDNLFFSAETGQRHNPSEIRSFNQKTKAYKVIQFSINTYDELLTLTGANSLDDFSGDALFLAKSMFAAKELRAIADEKNMGRVVSYYFDDKKSEPELMHINKMEAGFNILLPVSKIQLELLQENTKILKQ